MNGSELYIDKTVKITFTEHWPIESASYTYNGFDPAGHWVTSKAGRQRYLMNHDVALIEIIDTDADEGQY